MSISNTGDLNILNLICDICFLAIKEEPMIQCTICNIDICVHCFNDKIESFNHKKNHPYKILVVSSKNEYNWSILEELIFYTGLSKYGIGNWDLISLSIGTKSEKEVELFFYNVFNITKNTISYNFLEKRSSNPFNSKVSIYMNLRDDFDVEFMNDYEYGIRDLEFSDEDELIILKGYEKVQEMRKHKKNIIIKNEIINVDKQREIEKKYSKFVDMSKYKFLLEYINFEQYIFFIEGIYIENMIKEEIEDVDFSSILSSQEKKFCADINITMKDFCKYKQIYINNILEENNFELDSRILFFFESQNYYNIL